MEKLNLNWTDDVRLSVIAESDDYYLPEYILGVYVNGKLACCSQANSALIEQVRLFNGANPYTLTETLCDFVRSLL